MTTAEKYAAKRKEVFEQWEKYDNAVHDPSKPYVAILQINSKLVRLEEEEFQLYEQLKKEEITEHDLNEAWGV